MFGARPHRSGRDAEPHAGRSGTSAAGRSSRSGRRRGSAARSARAGSRCRRTTGLRARRRTGAAPADCGSATFTTAESRKTMHEPRTAATSVQLLWSCHPAVIFGAHPTIGPWPRSSRWSAAAPGAVDAELAIATELAREAGRLQMDRYGRLERIVHKGEHDLVTEADTLSESPSSTRSAGPLPGDGHPRRGVGRGPRDQAALPSAPQPSPAGGPTGVDRRPARRHSQLRERHPVLLRQHRTGDRWAAVGVVSTHPRRPCSPRWRARARRRRHTNPPPQQREADRLRVPLSLPRRGWAPRRDRIGRAIRVSRNMGSAALAIAYLGERPLRCLCPGRRPVAMGHLCRGPYRRRGRRPADESRRPAVVRLEPRFEVDRAVRCRPPITRRCSRCSLDRLAAVLGHPWMGQHGHRTCAGLARDVQPRDSTGAARSLLTFLPRSRRTARAGPTAGATRPCISTTARTSSTSAPLRTASGTPMRPSRCWPWRGSRQSPSLCRTAQRGWMSTTRGAARIPGIPGQRWAAGARCISSGWWAP